MSSSTEASAALADFVAGSDWDSLPEAVRHAARRSLLNFFAVALAGSRDLAIERAVRGLGAFAGPPQAGVIGRRLRVDAPLAAFLNAAAGNVHDFDDTHLRTVIHPTAPVAPALLALAAIRPVSGRALLEALALGIEAACRIGNAVTPEHYRRGWHITASCGVFGAALAAGKLLGLDRRGLLWALGVASSQAGGLVETLGFMAKSFGVGSAARNGLLAALLAEQGFDGPARPLEGPCGFFAVAGQPPRLEEVSEGLGRRWEVLKNIHKPYPCGIVLNPVIDACLTLRAGGTTPEAIRTLTLHGHPLLRQRADRPAVATGREAQVSAQHAVAACLVWGAVGLDQFSDAAVVDPALAAVKRCVRIVDDKDRPVAGVRLVAELADGSRETVVIENARGTDKVPLSDSEIEEKLTTLAAWRAGSATLQVRALIEAVWTLDEAPDAAALLDLAMPA